MLLRNCIERAIRRFDKLPLATRAFLTFTPLFIAVAWLSLTNGLTLYQSAQKLAALEDDTQHAVDAGFLVSALQNERAASSVYVASGGKLHTEKVIEARAITDQKLMTLKAALAEPGHSSAESNFKESLQRRAKALARLPSFRQRIDSLSISSSEVRTYLTHHVDALNELISHLSEQTNLNHVGRKLRAYFLINRLKELVAQERVLISSALISQSLTESQRQELIFNAGRQFSARIMLDTQTDSRKGLQALPIVPESVQFRDQLINAPDKTAILKSTSLQDWVSHQSERIAKLSKTESVLAQDILQETSRMRANAQRHLWRYIILSPLILMGSLGFAYLVFRHIKTQLQLAEAIFDHSHDRVTIADRNANIVEVNKAFTDITGYTRREVLGKNSRILQSGRQDKAFYKRLWTQLIGTGSWQGEIWNRRKNGEFYAEWTTISAVKNRKGITDYYVSVSSDITERARQHEAQLEFSAYHDPLTKLPNEALIRDRLRHALNLSSHRGKGVVVAALDIDHFRHINERHGHHVGDQLLEIVGQRLLANLREVDSLARTGGDEFLLVLESVSNITLVSQILERVQNDLAKPINLDGQSISVGSSIGATYFPEDSSDGDTLIRHAVQALHDAKRNGRGRLIWFDSEKDRSENALSQLLKQIENALDNDELVLHFQPKVNMQTGDVLGFEALLRWQDPNRGLVPPGEFLPHIENHPISITVGNWVIQTAIAQIERWKSEGIRTSVSVNINSLQLLAPNFVPLLEEQIHSHSGFDPADLELEILESAAINDIQLASNVLEQCRALGIRASLDDFGTGYASLNYLKQLPAETLKIDQCFVRDMQREAGSKAIVRGIIGLADAFGFQVIAEGVETEEQGKELVALGCLAGQGFGIGRPMPAAQVREWLAGWHSAQSWLDK
ncbi:Cyclic di-GMP phosphodiesterase Gmr [Marinobacter litoralis]|uniref:Cyclic di-GMP phosphodiesterase Gmr n=1 Tax=Marinobacter litoralis TaxID=187981 RepID=A0A3M2RG90_9GAMM|nr:EAL domain-containing protein [Marinobacter litoralis]RMJ04321.1 Cyclic di-GMP phosphodiesterase Gmr [Marinobacter litoralis]